MSVLKENTLRVPPEMIIPDEILSFSVFSSFNANYGPLTLKRNTYKLQPIPQVCSIQKKTDKARLFQVVCILSEAGISGGCLPRL